MKKMTTALFIFVFIVNTLSAQKNLEKVKIETPNDTLSYSLGVSIANNLKSEGITELNVMAIARAFDDVLKAKKMVISVENADVYLRNYFSEKQNKKSESAKMDGQKFLDENKTKEGVVTLPSGLQYKVIKEGTGATPKEADQVKVHYKGMLTDGTVFDSSYDRGEPIVLGVNQVISGWTEALQLMKVGSIWTLYIPYNLGYGEQGAGGVIPPYATLVFDVELLSIEN